MNTSTLMTQADQAIAQYDAFVYSEVGRIWDDAAEQKATVLAFYAEEACKIAAADKSEPASFRAKYRELAQLFKNIQ